MTGAPFDRGSGPGASDEEYLRYLHTHHGGAVLAYATRLTGNRVMAEDVLQETLVRAWRNRRTLDSSPGTERAWLFTVAHNIAMDLHRAARARPREVPEIPAGIRVERDHAEGVVISLSVGAALDTLSAEHRQVIRLLHFEQRTLAEASEIIGIPEGTVSSRFFHAKKALSKALGSGTEQEGSPP